MYLHLVCSFSHLKKTTNHSKNGITLMLAMVKSRLEQNDESYPGSASFKQIWGTSISLTPTQDGQGTYITSWVVLEKHLEGSRMERADASNVKFSLHQHDFLHFFNMLDCKDPNHPPKATPLIRPDSNCRKAQNTRNCQFSPIKNHIFHQIFFPWVVLFANLR